MLSSLLLKYFKNLTKQDRRDLSKFVRSPFHNQREEVVCLFDYVNEHIDNPSVYQRNLRGNELGTSFFKKEIVFQYVYPGNKKFNDALLRATMSQLTDLIKSFFVHNELKNNKKHLGEQSYLFRQALLKRGFLDEYEKYLLTDYQNAMNNQTRPSYDNFRILHERSYWQAKHKRSEKLFFSEMGENLDVGYVVELLRLACSMQSHKAILKVDYNLALLETVLNLIAAGWFEGHLYVEAFYHAYWTMQFREDNYEKLDKILTEFSHSFNQTDLHFLFKVAINYNTRQLNFAKKNADTALWKYLKAGFDKKILIEDNIVSPHDCISVLSLGLSDLINDKPWVDAFLKEYIKYLPLKDKENYTHLLDGIYHFYLKNYEKSMHSLKKVTFEDEHHQLRSRRMFTVMYFNQKEFDALVSYLDSFKVYLHRQKTMGYHRESHLNFIRIMEKLMKINLNSEKECAALWEQIEQIEYISMKFWFSNLLQKKSPV